jgi:hypothetical protein
MDRIDLPTGSAASTIFGLIDRMPVLCLAALGAVSGLAGSVPVGLNWGAVPDVGFYAPLTGLWFALVMAFAVWRWSRYGWAAVVLAFAGTWAAWEVAINLAVQLDGNWLQPFVPSGPWRMALAGVAAGAAGAALTFAGIAAFPGPQRKAGHALRIITAGTALGALLPLTDVFDLPALLFVTWEAAIAALIAAAWTSATRPV